MSDQEDTTAKSAARQEAAANWGAILAHLHRGGPWGYWWIVDRKLAEDDPEKKITHWWGTQAPAPLPPLDTRDVYFGVNPGAIRKGRRQRTKNEDVAAINCLFGDFDAKDYGGDVDAILAHIAGLAVAPSVLIASGGGIHAYWLLRSPFILANEEARDRARTDQAAWTKFVLADGGSKDIAHVLRPPHTLNHKYDPPRPVEIIRADLGRLYNLPDLETVSRPASLPTSPSNRNGNGAHHGPSDDAGEHWLTRALGLAKVGNRNRTGFDLACQLRDAGLSEGQAEPYMLAYARQVPQDPRDHYGDGQALASLKSAYKERARERAQSTTTRAAAPAAAGRSSTAEEPPAWLGDTGTGEASPPAGTAAKKTKPPAPTDDELADRWLAAHPDTAWGLGEFRRYAGGIWPVVPVDVIRREIKDVLEEAKVDGIRPTARLLASVMELARIEVAQPPEKWDADHDILICANGALHIPTRTLQAHDRTHYATSCLAFEYDPAAEAPVWAFVLNCCAPEAQGFLQEFAGYALTTDTRYETAVWLAGQPGGGKSTILEGLRAMLGARVCLLGLADIEKSRFALTNLPGKTLAISTEQPGGYVAAVQALNAIISGEPITVDRKFRDPVTVIPRAKIAWALNELPRVGSEGVGLFRRVKVLNFPPIPEADRDPNIKERVKLEGAGILNWALDGLARLRVRGRFEIPQSVQDATAHFREANDVPALFVAEGCATGTNPGTGLPYRAQGSALYKAYSDWCKDNGHKAASSTSIAEDWRRLGFEKKLIAGKSWWLGVGLVDTCPQVSTPETD